MDPANAQKDNGEREGSEGMTEKQKDMIHNLYFRKAFWWIGKPMRALTDREYKRAIDRLNAIPSEMEVIKYLHDTGKILYTETDRNGVFTNWLDYAESIDIRFVEPERHDITMTYIAGIDVKNVGIDYPNVYLETQKDNNGNDNWEFSGWVTHFYRDINGEPVRNRYLAFVRNGKAFGGRLATQTDAFSLDNTEHENKREIIRYYANHQDQLTHDIMIIYCDDIVDYIDQTGGTDIRQRKTDRKQTNAPETKAAIIKFNEWDKDYARVMITWNNDLRTWNEPIQYGARPLEIKARPVFWTAPDKDEYGLRKRGLRKTPDQIREQKEQELRHMAEDQRADLTADQYLKIEGIPEKYKSKETIIAEWKSAWNIDELSPEDQPEYKNIIPDGEKIIGV